MNAGNKGRGVKLPLTMQRHTSFSDDFAGLKAKVPSVLKCSQVGVMNVVILSRSHHEANRPKPTEEL